MKRAQVLTHTDDRPLSVQHTPTCCKKQGLACRHTSLPCQTTLAEVGHHSLLLIPPINPHYSRDSNPRALPQALRIKLPGAHKLLCGLKATRVQSAEYLHRARQPRVPVQEPQRVVVHVAALRKPP